MAATTGDEILVAAGTYTGVTFTGGVTQHLFISKTVTLQGGYTTSNWTVADPDNNLTILDAQDQGRVIYITGLASPRISGFTIRNGFAPGGANNGAGIFVENGSPVIIENIIQNNNAFFLGGGVFNNFGNLRLERNLIFNNTADSGAGFVNGSGTATSQNNVFRQNHAFFNGGAILNDLGTLTVQNDLFYNNIADNQGGALGNFGTMTVLNSIILSNTAATVGGISDLNLITGTTTSDYNIFHQNIAPSSNVPTGANSLTVDPLLVSPASGNFHLQVTSPARDKGTPIAGVSDDFEGHGRPFGADFDIGPDEITDLSGTCFARLDNSQVYTSVQEAVDNSASGSLIQVAGRCEGVTTRPGGLNQTLYIDHSLTVRGGYTVTDWVMPRYNTVLDADGAGRGIYVTGATDIILENLHVTGGSIAGPGGGIFLGNDGDSTLRNNVIYHNQATGSGDGGGIYLDSSGTTVLQHNTIFSNTAEFGGGLYDSSSGPVTLANSIVADNMATGGSGNGGGIYDILPGNISLRFNNFFQNLAQGNPGDYGGITPGTTDISVNPGFVNAAGGNFHLDINTSALINKADPASPVTTDFENDPRPQGSRADIGADESLLFAEVDVQDLTLPANPRVVTDTALIANSFITFTHTVTNLSNIGATDTFIITTANNNGWQVSLAGIASPVVLTNGVPVQFSVVVSVPSTVPTGLFNRTIITFTSQTNGNIFDATTDIIANPKLELTPSYTDTADPGTVLTYTHTLTNSGPVTDTINVSLNSPLGWGSLVAPTSTVTLGPGQSRPVIVRVVVANTAPANLAEVITVTAASSLFGISAVVTDTVTANATVGDRHVATVGSNFNNNCTQASTPCATISHAVGQAAFGDAVLVAQGVYNDANINIVLDIDLLGGYIFDGEAFNLPGGGVDPAATVINAAGGRGINVDVAQVFQPQVSGFTIRNASTTGFGGGLFLQNNASPLLRNLIITQSSASRGAGIYINGGSPVLDNVIIDRTTAGNLGGGLFINGGAPRANLLVISNTVAGSGGGIYIASGSPVISNSSVYSATATDGAGIFQNGGLLTAYKLSLTENRANNRGGGLFRLSGTATISQSRVGSNTATSGAGIYNTGGPLNLWNSLVYSNTASGSGAGIYNTTASASLSAINDTFFGNGAATSGGGIFNTNSAGLVISNTIVVANSGGGITHSGGSSPNLAYNNVFGNSGGDYNGLAAGPNSISVDPRFASTDPADLDFLHLLFDSPSVDSASPNTFINRDIEDDIRPVNQGFDMGADEVSGCLARIERTDEVFGIVQDAIDAAANSDVIQISGICRGVLPRVVGSQTLSQTALITKNLTLQGGYDASFNTTGEPTILDAQNDGRVVVVTGSVSVNITNLQLTGGNAAGLGGKSGGGDAGGGLYSNGAILEVMGSVITGNQAGFGGGLYALNGNVTLGGDEALEQTNVVSNTANFGAGLYLEGTTYVGERLLIQQNRANQDGGGFYNAATGIISQTNLLSNTAGINGGGLYNTGNLQLAQVITNAYNTAANGAGVYNQAGGRLNLERSVILSNGTITQTTQGGGLFNAASGVLTLTNTIVASNTTSGNGGGLHNQSANLAVRHGTFYRNNAGGQGGGIYYNNAGTPPLINSTLIVSNTASADGGGLFSTNASGINFRYNDVFGNTPNNYNNTFGPDLTNISANPQFLSTDPANADFLRIAGGSPAEDGGDPASPVIIDIEEDPRPSSQDPDIGVDEVSNCFVRINGLPPTYGNIQVAIGQSANGDELRVAGSCQGVNPFIDATQTVSQTAFLTKSLTIRGGFTNQDWSTQAPVANPTFLDALDLGRVLYITNSARITIDGLRLAQGFGGNGGAVFVGSGALTMTRSAIYTSTATNGGALYNAAGIVHLFDDNEVYSNTATNGGAFYNAGGTFTLEDNFLRNNTATNGGAFFHDGGTSQLWNNIIRLNQANQGGAIYNDAANLTVWHNTFVANHSPSGAGLFTTQAAVALRNNIFYNHTGGSVIHSDPAAFTVDFNGIFPNTPSPVGGSASLGSNNIALDPLFVDAAAGDYHLLDNSPVVDKGDAAVTLFVDFDDEETPTVPRDLRPGGQGFDMGADEIPGCRARIVRVPGVVYGNLQLAVNNSLPGDTIQVTANPPACGGVHPFNIGGQMVSQTVHITHNLTLVGGFMPDFSELVLDGLTVIDPVGLGRALLVTGTTRVTMENFFLQNGRASGFRGGPGGADAGGGIYFNGAGGLLNNVTIYSSTAAYGGGLFNTGNALSMTNSSVWSNTATIDGGGIYNEGPLDLADTEVQHNQANNGAGLYNTGVINLESNDVFSNTALAGGGGLYNNSALSVSLDRGNRFYDNTAANGGAFYNNAGNPIVQNNFFFRNRAFNQGGALFIGAGSPTVRHNTFYSNTGIQFTSQGGAIYISSGGAIIRNNIFDSNNVSNVSNGDAIFRAGGSPNLEPNAYWPGSASAQVGNIAVNNANNPNVNPNFVNPALGDFHLNTGSGLIDHSLAVNLNLPHDFEDDPRPVNTNVEMGADEFSSCLAKVMASGTIYGRLQSALDAAPSGTEVRVKQGTCFENVNVTKPVNLTGSWTDKNFNTQTPNNSTFINGGSNNRVFNIDNVTTGPVNFSKLVVTNGRTGGNGGGILNQATTLNLSLVDVISNTAANGGGIYHEAGTLNLSTAGISNNKATADGGGIYIGSSLTATILGASMDLNQALGGNGGAIYNGANSLVDIMDGGMIGNSAGTHGGAVYNASGSTVTIEAGFSIELNTAGGNGGGIYNDSAILTLAQKRVNDNQAENGGGIFITGASQVTSQNLGLFGNVATDTLSAIGNGGGLYREGIGSTRIFHATIHTNQAENEGGGIYNAIGGSMVISASIIAYNEAPNGGSGINGVGTVNVAYSLQESSNSYVGVVLGSGNLQNLDPRLREPGGDLEYTSPAIDAVPADASDVTVDRFSQTRESFPLRICAKDMGRDEFNVRRGMTWVAVNNPTPPESIIAPTESMTYTFFLRNDSENLTPDNLSSLGLGTGYTETVTVTLNSSQGWAEFIEDPVLGIISGTTTATFDLGPGVTANLKVKVTVPPGQTATVTGVDAPKDLTSITYVASLCPGEATLSASSPAAITRVRANRSLLFEADQTAAPALPGQTLTFTHIITNTGNITDTYIIVPSAFLYTNNGSTARVENLGPGMSSTVVLSVTVNAEAAGGLIGRANFEAHSEADLSVSDNVIDTIPILFTTGTRHVSLNGLDSLIDETSGSTETNTINVSDNNCTQPQIGACRTIQHALSQAAPGDLIKIEQGSYGEVLTDILTVTHQSQVLTQIAFVDKSITLEGGYNRNNWDESPPNHISQTTTLDLQNLGRAIHIATTDPVTISRLTLLQGNASGLGGGPGGEDAGGLIYSEGGDLVLQANRLQEGSAEQGGALYNDSGDLILQNNMIHGNTATTGGAVYVAGGNTSLENNTFYNNQATNGGAAYIDAGNLVITNTIFADNIGDAVSIDGSVNDSGNYNLYNGNTANDYVVGGASQAPPGANNVFGDPFFNNEAETPPDLHIQSGSAARDTGSPATTLNIDYDNNLRPLPALGSFDIGADERVPVQSLLFYSSTFTSTLANSTVVITHYLQNTGDVTDTYTITANSSQGWPFQFVQPLPYNITLAPGISQTVVVTYSVPATASGQTNLTVITATSTLSSVFEIVTDEIKARSAAWEITKQVTPDTFIQPGGSLTYTITITNVGDLDTGTTPYTVTDILPEHTNFVSATPTASLNGSTLQWVTNTNVATGASMIFSYVVTVTQPLTDGLPIVNETYSVAGGGAPVEVFGTPVTVTVEAGAILSASKSANVSLVQPGDFLTYTITITNDASALAPATNILITDTLPAQAVYQDMGFVGATTGVTSATGSDLSWQLAEALQPGDTAQVMVTVRITSPLAAPATITNTFGITSSSISEVLSGTLTTAITATNDITMSKVADPANVASGGMVTYTLTLTNSGNGIATVSLTDTLAAGFSPATYLNTIQVPGRDWTTDGVTTVSFTATVPITGGVYSNPAVTATFEITSLTLVDTAPITVEAAITGLTLTNSSPTSLGQPTFLTATITGGNDVSYILDFGDSSGVVTGTLTPNTPISLSHTYPTSGTFIAIITATNNVSTQVATTTVIIQEDVAGLTLANNSPTLLGQPTTLTATITAGNNVTYTLNFGDGTAFNTGPLQPNAPLPINHTYLNIGTYTATITATNGTSTQVATTTVVIVASPPVLIAPPDGTLTRTQNITFSWSTVAGAASYDFNLDGVIQNVAATSSAQVLAEGVHTWTVATVDAFGQPSVFTDVWTVTVDLTPPSVPAPISPLTGTTLITNAVDLTWGASTDNLSGVVSYTVLITRGGVTTPTTVGNVTSLNLLLADGVYTWTVQAIDGAGNVSAFSAPHRFVVDSEPPDKPILIAPPNGTITNTANIDLVWSQVSSLVTYTVYLSGDTFLLPDPGTDPVVSSMVLADGVYTWTVEAVDGPGRTSGVTDTWTFTVDATPPSVPTPISPTASQTVLTSTVPFSWGASTDNLTGVVSYTLVVTGPNGATTTNLGNVTSTSLVLTPDGDYSWSIQAIDGAGNPSGFTAPISFTVDASGPARPILIAPPNGTITTTQAITLEWSDVVQAVTYTLHLNSSTFDLPDGAGATIISPTVLAEGVYTWSVEAIDSFGRSSGLTDTWVFTIDLTAPPVPVLIAPPDGTITRTNPLTFSWSDVGPDADHYNLHLTYGVTTTILGPFTNNQAQITLPFGDGVYTWTVQAVDAGGNASAFADPAFTVTLDATAPPPPVLLAPANGAVFTQSGTITFSWTASADAFSGPVIYTLSISGQAPQSLPGTSQTVNFTTDGVYTWTVSARDQLGNTVTTDTLSFEVDLTGPAAPVLLAPPNGTLTQTANINFDWSTVTDTGTLTYSLLLTDPLGSLQTTQTNISNQNLTLGSGDGVYTWTVRVDDRFGRSSITDSWTLTLDTTPPTSPTLISPPDGAVFTQTNVITFEWTASVDALSPVSYTLSISGQPLQVLSGTSQVLTLPEGVYTWTVWATDLAGNRAITDTLSFIVDNNAPPKPVLLSPPDQTFTNNPNVIFSWRPATDTVTYTLNVNGSLYPVPAPTTSQAFNNLAEGVYIWTVRSEDIYGRTLGYTDTWRLVMDRTPPTLPNLISPANGSVISTTARPVFDWADSTDALSGPVTYTVTITNSSGVASTFTVTASTFTPGSDLPPGIYTWSVQAFDRAGNSSSAGPFTVTIQAPVTNLFLPLLVKVFAPDGPPPPPNLPDLVIDDITLIKKAGNTYTVRVTARNRAATPVTFGNNFYVNVYLDGNLNSPIIGFGVQASWFGAGQSRVLEQDYTFSSGGPHTLRAWADPFNTVVEGVETNNTRDLSLTVAGAAQGVAPKDNPLLPPGPQPTPTTIPGSR